MKFLPIDVLCCLIISLFCAENYRVARKLNEAGGFAMAGAMDINKAVALLKSCVTPSPVQFGMPRLNRASASLWFTANLHNLITSGWLKPLAGFE